ncbi:MAG TPA: alpha/beta fold hydrolase [Kofleriaceae bacterium]|nr:alpha/beta fold hydrolase [Kofleriaceae bacterium]
MDVLAWQREVGQAWTNVAADLLGISLPSSPPLAQTPRDEFPLEGGARLYRFRAAAPSQALPARATRPFLLIPSMINRWYVLDLRPGASLVEALVRAHFDVWCLDWGTPEAEDRYLDWEAVLARLGRAVRRVKRETGADKLGVLGYCMGGTLTTIYAAQHADEIAALVTLAAPIDFQNGGQLRCMVEPQWFDADAIADAGNVEPTQMQSGFTALRPTLELGKLASLPDLMSDAKAREGFLALDAWASDNIPFPAEAYRRYIREMYQANQLVDGSHRVANRDVKLSAITCPTLVITASRDQICPPAAATALLDLIGSTDKQVLDVPGGHVGAVVGSRAARDMYPALVRWLEARLAATVQPPSTPPSRL